MIPVCKISGKRLAMPVDTGFHKDTEVWLCCKRSDRKLSGGPVIELFWFISRFGQKALTLETDTVLDWWQLPDITRDKKRWEKVRQLIIKDEMPEDAYLKVAVGILARQWRYTLSLDSGVSENYNFYIHRAGGDMIASMLKDDDPPLWPAFIYDREAEAREKEDEEEAARLKSAA